MAPKRRSSNGRSALVNERQKITAFFTKPNPSPTTPPSPHKPPLVIGPDLSSSPDSANILYGQEIVDKRIKVYCPLDKSWYAGRVNSFDNVLGKHLVRYDDANQELLTLSEEKIEWELVPGKTKFRRLPRSSVVGDKEDKKRS